MINDLTEKKTLIYDKIIVGPESIKYEQNYGRQLTVKPYRHK